VTEQDPVLKVGGGWRGEERKKQLVISYQYFTSFCQPKVFVLASGLYVWNFIGKCIGKTYGCDRLGSQLECFVLGSGVIQF
jgi:hypothetical protein